MRASMSPPSAFSSISIQPRTGAAPVSAASQMSPLPSCRKSRIAKSGRRRLLHVVAERSHARHDLVAAERLHEAGGDRARTGGSADPTALRRPSARRVERPELVGGEASRTRPRVRRTRRRAERRRPGRRRSLRSPSTAPCSECETDVRRETRSTGSSRHGEQRHHDQDVGVSRLRGRRRPRSRTRCRRAT